jgi:uncharacterized protein (DUF1684 family)
MVASPSRSNPLVQISILPDPASVTRSHVPGSGTTSYQVTSSTSSARWLHRRERRICARYANASRADRVSGVGQSGLSQAHHQDGTVDMTEPAKTKRITVVVEERGE